MKTMWLEAKRLKWAIIAAVIPLFLLDVVGLQFGAVGELRWVPILQKLSTISIALVLAHLSWVATFPYLGLSDLQDKLMATLAGDQADRDRAFAIAMFALGTCVLRGLFGLAVILGFSMGL